jgi:hypothetical protein
MKSTYFGDSYDIVKKSMIAWLPLGASPVYVREESTNINVEGPSE